MTKNLLYKNRYMKRSHLSERKFREILKAFCIDITAKDTMDLTGISRYTLNKKPDTVAISCTKIQA